MEVTDSPCDVAIGTSERRDEEILIAITYLHLHAPA